jgi:hypothetical protein
MLSVAAFLVAALALTSWTFGQANKPNSDLKTEKDQKQRLVLVELFTSEGCSSCPPADDILRKIVETQPIIGVKVLALGLHVDYWNRLGWKDPFSQKAFTQRQHLYASRFNNETVYTPQAIVQGSAELVGSQEGNLLRAIKEAPKERASITLTPTDGTVQVNVSITESSKQTNNDVWIAEVETNLSTDVKRGENAGELLRHAPTARILQKLGNLPVGEGNKTFSYRPSMPLTAKYHLVAFVQEEHLGSILAAAEVEL